MDLLEELGRRGGVARTRTLVAAGISMHTLRRAKEAATIRTIRKGWVAAQDADEWLLGAAMRGVVLSCVTAAERCGLWVPQRGLIHVAAATHATRVKVPEGAIVHWSNPVIARDPDSLEDGIANALSLVAQCQPHETALVIWESALNKGLVDLPLLRGLDLPPGRAADAG